MIYPPLTKLTWDSPDAKVLKDFLDNPVGRKVLQFLDGRIPSLADGANVNQTLVRSGEVKGARELLDSLISLTIEPPAEVRPVETTSNNYPSLDAGDDVWKAFDNQQL